MRPYRRANDLQKTPLTGRLCQLRFCRVKNTGAQAHHTRRMRRWGSIRGARTVSWTVSRQDGESRRSSSDYRRCHASGLAALVRGVRCGFHGCCAKPRGSLWIPRTAVWSCTIRYAIGSRIESDSLGRCVHPDAPSRSLLATRPISASQKPHDDGPCLPMSASRRLYRFAGPSGRSPGHPAGAPPHTTGSATPASDLRPRPCARASSSPDRRR